MDALVLIVVVLLADANAARLLMAHLAQLPAEIRRHSFLADLKQ